MEELGPHDLRDCSCSVEGKGIGMDACAPCIYTKNYFQRVNTLKSLGTTVLRPDELISAKNAGTRLLFFSTRILSKTSL